MQYRDYAALFAMALLCSTSLGADSTPVAQPAVTLQHDMARDQDDLCFWRNDVDPALSLVITSDKKAHRIAVYDLDGTLLQTLPLPKPGNIDLRRQVPLGGSVRDVVAVNVREEGGKLALFEVDPQSRQLQRLDDGTLATGPNYGICLYHRREPSRLDAVLTSETGAIRQFEITWTPEDRPALRLAREWNIGKAEAAVADDAAGQLYVSEEEGGVWLLDAAEESPAPGALVVRLGENSLEPDLEGVALAGNLLLLSCQSQNRFYVFDRTAGHALVGTFQVAGAQETDGIDIITEACGTKFPGGIFGCHTSATTPCPVLLTPWERISGQLHGRP